MTACVRERACLCVKCTNVCRLYLVLCVALDKKKHHMEVFNTSTHTIKFSTTRLEWMNLYVIFTICAWLCAHRWVHAWDKKWEIQLNLDAQMFLSTGSLKGTWLFETYVVKYAINHTFTPLQTLPPTSLLGPVGSHGLMFFPLHGSVRLFPSQKWGRVLTLLQSG